VLLAAHLVQPHLPAGTLWPQILKTEVHLRHRPVKRHPLAPSPAERRLQSGAVRRPAAKKISYSILAGVASRQ
jgi:hypothetical protein